MAQRTLSALGVLAQQVADETAPGANTAERVGDILQDIIDSCGKNEYVALVTQTGTSAPVATVIKNTLGGTVVWSRSGAGSYAATLSGAFPAAKTFISNPINLLPFSGTDFIEVDYARANDNAVTMSTLFGANGAGVATDALISAFPVKIEVYP